MCVCGTVLASFVVVFCLLVLNIFSIFLTLQGYLKNNINEETIAERLYMQELARA